MKHRCKEMVKVKNCGVQPLYLSFVWQSTESLKLENKFHFFFCPFTPRQRRYSIKLPNFSAEISGHESNGNIPKNLRPSRGILTLLFLCAWLLLLQLLHNLKLTSVIKVCGVQHVLICCNNAWRVRLEVCKRGDLVEKKIQYILIIITKKKESLLRVRSLWRHAVAQ